MANLAQHASLIGTGLEAAGTIASGRYAQAAGAFQGRQLRQRATAERASASYRVSEEHRQKRLIQSRARAVAAASGGGAVPELIAGLEREGELRALTALWEGETGARALQTQAAAAEATGRHRFRQSLWGVGATLAEAAPSLWEKYGSGEDDEF